MIGLRRKHARATVLLILLVGVIISGCATSKPGGQNMGVSKPQKPFFSRHDDSRPPDDPILHKALPEMTSDELEALGDRYFGRKDYYMAFVQYEKALEHQPDSIRIHYKQGLLYLHTRQHDAAVKSFQKVVRKDPENALAHEWMGTAFFEMRNYNESETHLRRAIELNPGLWKSRNLMGNIYDFQKKYDQATREYAEAILRLTIKKQAIE